MMLRTSRRPMGSRPDIGSSRMTQLGVVDQGLGQARPLHHALGEAPQGDVAGPLEPDEGEQLARALAAHRRGQAEEAAHVVEVLARR